MENMEFKKKGYFLNYISTSFQRDTYGGALIVSLLKIAIQQKKKQKKFLKEYHLSQLL